MNISVPLNDLRAEYHSIRAAVDARIQEVIDTSSFIGGANVAGFEDAFADYCGAAHAVFCSSGTSAIYIALKALEIGPDDEVITVSHTFIATVEAISLTGAVPVLIDVDRETGLLDHRQLAGAVTKRTRAIIPVHLYGHPVNWDPIQRIADQHNIPLIEDAAQAVGAVFHDRKIGSLGAMACFSFFPGKNLGAYGDAGMITTQNATYAANMKRFLNHGRISKYAHETIGFNLRGDAMQAAILHAKLPSLDSWNACRRRNAETYRQELQDVSVQVLCEAENVVPVYHQFVLLSEHREALQDFLHSHGIATGIHYPIPVHLQPAYQSLGYGKGDFPGTEYLADRILSIPVYPFLTKEQIQYVVDTIHLFFRK